VRRAPSVSRWSPDRLGDHGGAYLPTARRRPRAGRQRSTRRAPQLAVRLLVGRTRRRPCLAIGCAMFPLCTSIRRPITWRRRRSIRPRSTRPRASRGWRVLYLGGETGPNEEPPDGPVAIFTQRPRHDLRRADAVPSVHGGCRTPRRRSHRRRGWERLWLRAQARTDV